MLVSQVNASTHRSSAHDKENRSSSSDYESLKSIVSRNEQALIEIRRELKQKVNKTDFLAGLSSKVSLSDISTFSAEMQPQDHSCRQNVREEIEREVAHALRALSYSSTPQFQVLSKSIQQLTAQLQSLEQSCRKREGELLREMREGDQGIIERVERKAERSELDKIMHLSSLLAIQFQLIKKRFGSFEIDYNLIWKEISALYTHHESLRSVFETERKESIENTREKQLQVLLKTSKNHNIVGKLFAEKEEVRPFDSCESDRALTSLQQRIENVEHSQRNQEFSIKNFLERLSIIEKDFQNQSQLVKDVKQLKRQYNNSKEEILYLEERNRKMKDEVEEMVGSRCAKGLQEMGSNINGEIREACEQITSKMMCLFEQCSKLTEIGQLRREIGMIDQQLTQQMEAINENYKKKVENFGIRLSLHEDKLRLMANDISARLKAEDFDHIRQGYMTSEASLALVKKTEAHIKKELAQFRESQKSINDVICSQTILARWIWVSGELKCGNLISWDREAINTLPDNFTYLRPELTFRIASGGIYRLEMGFYAKKKPSIQVIINGKTIVSAVNSSSYVVHHSSGKLKDISNSEVAGLTYYDFFTLQENTRLAISYNGEPGHGFFGIQRL